MKTKNIVASSSDEVPTSIKEAMGRRVKDIRTKRGVSQKELSDRIGISFQKLSSYERGKLRLPADVAVSIAQALQVSVDELLGTHVGGDPTGVLLQRFKDIETKPRVIKEEILKNLEIFMRGLER